MHEAAVPVGNDQLEVALRAVTRLNERGIPTRSGSDGEGTAPGPRSSVHAPVEDEPIAHASHHLQVAWAPEVALDQTGGVNITGAEAIV